MKQLSESTKHIIGFVILIGLIYVYHIGSDYYLNYVEWMQQ